MRQHFEPVGDAGQAADPCRCLRRLRCRLAAAPLSLVLAVSLVALVPSAANAAADDVRVERLQGATRYETATAVAKAYVSSVERGTSRRVDTVILTSGAQDHFGYVLPAPALARRHNAPVLLTETDALPNTVRRFLADFNIRSVIILGGTSVVSSAVQSSLNQISGLSTRRISGTDVYETAVNVANAAGTPGAFGTAGRTAMLATGASFADALAAGPLAYRGQHPILLTERDSASSGVLDYLRQNDVRQVVILGGTAAVSSQVQQAVERLNVQVRRWQGKTRIETAIDAARAVSDNQTGSSCFDGDEAGLASAWKHPDAIVSGPYLGELCAPLLLSDLATLPAPVQSLLQSDDVFQGDSNGRLRLTVFGGTAAISETVSLAAQNAAGKPPVIARISASQGGCEFTVTFTSPVTTETALTVSNYLRANNPLSPNTATVEYDGGATASEVRVVLAGGFLQSGASVRTGCAAPLKARERLGVIAGRIKAASGRQTVRRADSFARADSAAPRLSITAVQGATEVAVTANEPIRATTAGNTTISVRFERAGTPAITEFTTVDPGGTRFSVSVPSNFDVVADPTRNIRASTGLLGGDLVTIVAGQVEDLAGNDNILSSRRVVVDNAGPVVNRITATRPAPVSRALVNLDGEGAGRDLRTGSWRILTREGGAADGAEGNEWAVNVEVLGAPPADWGSTTSVRAVVSNGRKAVNITTVASTTLDRVVSGLNRDSAFQALFKAEVVGGQNSLAPRATNGSIRMRDGQSTVDIAVRWSEPVKECNTGQQAVRPGGIEIDVNRDGATDFSLDGVGSSTTTGVQFVGDPTGRSSIQAGGATCDTRTPGALSGSLIARVQSSNILALPSNRSGAYVRPQTAYDLSGNVNRLQGLITIRLA